MPANLTLGELLLRWEELRQRGQAPTAEELCRACPELREELQRQIQALEAMDRMLHSTGPAAGDTAAAAVAPASQRPGYEQLRPSAELVPGYRLVGLLGRGGFGEVWKATGPGGFLVALKFVSLPGRVGAAELRSLEIVKGLRHPNLLVPFGAWQIPGFLVIGMELADQTLYDRYRQAIGQGQPGIPRRELLDYLREAAQGIDYLNSPQHVRAGQEGMAIGHRDIKPQNILLLGGGVKVADFGLVRLLQHSVTGHTGSLTVGYAAPEFFNGQTSRFSDQYSLAVTYCHLRGGRMPFSGNAGQIMAGHLSRPPDLSMLPAEERPVVSRALAKEPAQRWPTCREFVEALVHSGQTVPMAQAPLQGTPTVLVAALTPSRVIPSLKPSEDRQPCQGSRRVRWRWWAGVTVVAIALIAAAVPFLWKTKEPPSRELSEEDSAAEIRCFEGHTGPVRTAIFSPDGRRVLSGGDDKIVYLWDAGTGKEVRRFEGHQGTIRNVAFSSDGLRALSYGDDQTVRVWDVERGGEIHRSGLRKLSNLVFFPDGRRVLFDGRAEGLYPPPGSFFLHLELRDVERGRLLDEISYHRINGGVNWFASTSAALSSDGRWVLFGGPGFMRLWDVEKKVAVRDLPGPMGHVWGIAISPDGRRAVSANEDRTVRLWDVEKGMEIHSLLGHTAAARAVALAPDGRRALSGGDDKTVRLWDLETGKESHCFQGHEGPIRAVAFSAAGRHALSGGDDKLLRLWRLPK